MYVVCSMKHPHSRYDSGHCSGECFGDHWGIVDHSWGLQDAIMEGMVEPDYESEDDPDN